MISDKPQRPHILVEPGPTTWSLLRLVWVHTGFFLPPSLHTRSESQLVGYVDVSSMCTPVVWLNHRDVRIPEIRDCTLIISNLDLTPEICYPRVLDGRLDLFLPTLSHQGGGTKYFKTESMKKWLLFVSDDFLLICVWICKFVEGCRGVISVSRHLLFATPLNGPGPSTPRHRRNGIWSWKI